LANSKVVLVSIALLGLSVAASIPASARASARASSHSWVGSHSHGFDNDRESLGWAIVSGNNTSMSDMKDLDSMDMLKSEFGKEFLYIRLGEDRYVIRDPALMRRAQDAVRPMQEAGQEIGEAARAQAEQALAGSQDTREQARPARRLG